MSIFTNQPVTHSEKKTNGFLLTVNFYYATQYKNVCHNKALGPRGEIEEGRWQTRFKHKKLSTEKSGLDAFSPFP